MSTTTEGPGESEETPSSAPRVRPVFWTMARGFVYVFVGTWLLCAHLLDPGNPANDRNQTEQLLRVLRITLLYGVLGAILAPFAAALWRVILREVVPRMLALDAEAAKGLAKVLADPLMRVLSLVFVGTWLLSFGFGFTALPAVGPVAAAVAASEDASWAAIGTLAAVALWRLAARNRG